MSTRANRDTPASEPNKSRIQTSDGPGIARYVTYFRVSTKKQGDSGLGLEAQQRDIEIYLHQYSREPWEVIGSFTDIESGANSERPELENAIGLAKAKKATLLVAKLDRLSRRVSFISALMEDKGLEFKVACFPAASNFMLHIYAALAEQEREFISVRTKQALQAAKARGKKLGGIRPNAARKNEAKKNLAKAQAEQLRSILTPLIAAGLSSRAIAKTLNDTGLRTAQGARYSNVAVLRAMSRLELHP